MATTNIPTYSSFDQSPAVSKARAPQRSRYTVRGLQNEKKSVITLRDANTKRREFECITGSTKHVGANVRFRVMC